MVAFSPSSCATVSSETCRRLLLIQRQSRSPWNNRAIVRYNFTLHGIVCGLASLRCTSSALQIFGARAVDGLIFDREQHASWDRQQQPMQVRNTSGTPTPRGRN